MQVFHHSTNTLSRLSIFGALFAVLLALWLGREVNRSPYVTQANTPREQPVQFSHAHHVGGIGIVCRYCHTTGETSAMAGIPPTRTCMNCHSQIWSDSPSFLQALDLFHLACDVAARCDKDSLIDEFRLSCKRSWPEQAAYLYR